MPISTRTTPARTTHDDALHLLSLDLALVPLPRGSKAPRHARWNRPELLITTLEALRQHPLEINLGVHLGASRLLSLDIDDLELSRTIFSERGLDLDQIIRAHPHAVLARGQRLWYRLEALSPEDQVLFTSVRNLKVGGKVAFELRCGNGAQDVGPGSLHPLGMHYRWSKVPVLRDELPGAAGWLVELYRSMAVRKVSKEKVKKEKKLRDSQAADLDCGAPPAAAGIAAAGVPAPLSPSPRAWAGPDLIGAYLAARTPEDLLSRNGYIQVGERWLSPRSESGMPGVVISQAGHPRARSYHASDDLAAPEDSFGLLKLLECGGDMERALQAAARELGWVRQGAGWAPVDWRPSSAAQAAMARWREGGERLIGRLQPIVFGLPVHRNAREALMNLAMQIAGMAGDQLAERRTSRNEVVLELQVGSHKTFTALVGGHPSSVNDRMRILELIGFADRSWRDEDDHGAGRRLTVQPDPDLVELRAPPGQVTLATRATRVAAQTAAQAAAQAAGTGADGQTIHPVSVLGAVGGDGGEETKEEETTDEPRRRPPEKERGKPQQSLLMQLLTKQICRPEQGAQGGELALPDDLQGVHEGALSLRGLWVLARLDIIELVQRRMISALQDQAGYAASQIERLAGSAGVKRWLRTLKSARQRLSRLEDGEAPWSVLA